MHRRESELRVELVSIASRQEERSQTLQIGMRKDRSHQHLCDTAIAKFE